MFVFAEGAIANTLCHMRIMFNMAVAVVEKVLIGSKKAAGGRRQRLE